MGKRLQMYLNVVIFKEKKNILLEEVQIKNMMRTISLSLSKV